MSDIFISYAREDQERAERLKSLLDAEGWDVWWDQEIRIGKPYSKEIDKALAQAKIVFVLWSKNSVASKWVRKEAKRARGTWIRRSDRARSSTCRKNEVGWG